MDAKMNPKSSLGLSFDGGGLYSIAPEATVFEAVELMKKHQVGDLLVIDLDSKDQRLQGLITERDVALTVTENKDSKNLKVVDVMTKNPPTASENDDFFKLATQLQSSGLTRLPLVDGQGKVVSVVTAKNLLDILVKSLFDMTQVTQTSTEILRIQH